MYKFFNPGLILKLYYPVFYSAVLITISSFAAGLYFAIFASPADYQQGEMVRIMYVHVPAAWMSLGIYSFMAIFSACYLIWRNYTYFIIARNAASIGTAFALITLVTGSLWGKPIWGAWWVFDARLTSMLILFFFYIGYIALSQSFDNIEQAAKSASILSIIGFINVPLVKFSVNFWNSLHQPASILRKLGPSIHPSMLTPLLLMFLAFSGYFIVILIVKVKTDLILRKSRRLASKYS
jgi:heme exporter protein C